MKIAGLSMDGFGVFNGVTVEDLPAGLVLVLGENEAGKSTALAFIHTVLFGYPDGRSKSEKSYLPLRGGTPGGRLMVHTDCRGAATIERKSGPRGGRVAVTFPDGEAADATALEKILGGTNRQLYRNLYGFSLSELQTIDTLTNEDVRDVIYGASLGTGFRTLPEARRRLERRMGELFKAGGQKPIMNELLEKLEETRKHLRDAQRSLVEYEEAGRIIADLTALIDETRYELTRANERCGRVRSLLDLWEDWVALQEALPRLAALEDRVEVFPDQGLARLDELTAAIARETDELKIAESDLEAKRVELKELAFDQALLDQSAEIAGLMQGLKTYERAVQTIPTTRDRVEQSTAQVADTLAELGADWTEGRALAMDRSTHIKEDISNHRSSLDQATKGCVALASEREHDHLAFRDAEKTQAATRIRVEELEATSSHLDRAILEKLRNGGTHFTGMLTSHSTLKAEHRDAAEAFGRTLRELRDAIHFRYALETELESKQAILEMMRADSEPAAGPDVRRLLLVSTIALVALGIVGGAVLWSEDQNLAASIAAGTAALLGVVLILIRRTVSAAPAQRRPPALDPFEVKARVHELSKELGELALAIDKLQDDLGIVDSPALTDVDRLATETNSQIDDLRQRLRELELGRAALKDAEERTATAATKVGLTQTKLAAAKASRTAAESTWTQWLVDHDMDTGWSPETAEHALGRVIRLVEVSRDREFAERDVERFQQEAAEYRQRADAVFEHIGRALPSGDQLFVEIRRLEEERDEHERRRILHSKLATEIRKGESACEPRRQRIEQTELKRNELIADGGANDEEEFRRRGIAYGNAKTLAAEVEARSASIRRLAGTADLDSLEAELVDEDRDRLSAKKIDLESRIHETRHRLDEALERRGAAEKHQQILYSDDRVAQLRTREEGLLEDLEVLARDWARHAVANHLLDAAKERHAQANQPRVIRAASTYFETITEGRYKQVFAPPGENSMKIIDSEGRSKDAADLSRGSMEQLYLAIRFGYISTQDPDSDLLPILMDDVLVNFDPKRAKAAANAILQLAQSRQILFFTCHPTLVEMFHRLAPHIPVYQIADATIERLPLG